MRSDARKRMERINAARTAPLGVGRDEHGDWVAVCVGDCFWPLYLICSDWNDAYEAALGHACLHHRDPS